MPTVLTAFLVRAYQESSRAIAWLRHSRESQGRLISKQSVTFQILNPHPGAGTYTSKRNAERLIARGLAVLSGERAICLLEEEQVRLARRVQADMRQDERYWREIAVQRGGQEVFFVWKPSMSNGYVVMGATPIAIQKSAQLAKGAAEDRRC